ncbi:putative large T antigen [Gammapolyomavirus corvi]|uniref:Large T antigen n=1 Tax=Gammapolyomavirus corvi TaxID=1891748 RepID=Q20HY2_9POLY|nr:putative large T antigen [Crow polyomavirus]ABB04268.1 putative large T antigen [Gammapolyomavirus corvi]
MANNMRADIAELRQLLDLPKTASYEKIKAAYRRKALMYHPDKGGDEEKMKRLNQLMDVARKYDFSAETLQCEETLYSSDEEDVSPGPSQRPEDTGYESFSASFTDSGPAPEAAGGCSGSPPPTPGSGSFSTPPKSQREICLPADVEACLLAAKSIQSCPEGHLVVTTHQKLQELQSSLLNHFDTAGHLVCKWGTDFAIMLIILTTGTRISTVLNFCKKHCTVSPLCVRGLKKHCLQKLVEIFTNSPNYVVTDNALGKETLAGPFNYALLNDYACKQNISDALFLLAVYKRMSVNPDECKDCKEDRENSSLQRLKRRRPGGHLEDHATHHMNAKMFLQLREQKRACQEAVDAVLAERRFKTLTMTREEQFNERIECVLASMKEMLDSPQETNELCCAIYLLNFLIKDPKAICEIIKTLVRNPPKRRYFVFRGTVNTGKTTVAAAILNLLTGASLNINGNPDRLQFELGCAIDQMMVLFEDVKGEPEADYEPYLPRGMGMINLDNLRDHLEGAVPVNLERKHQNKIAQIFPPGIITMNHYKIPLTVRVRCKNIMDFKRDPTFKKALQANPVVVQKRLLTRPEVLLGLLILADTEVIDKKQISCKSATCVECLKFEFDERWRYYGKLYEGESCFEQTDT